VRLTHARACAVGVVAIVAAHDVRASERNAERGQAGPPAVVYTIDAGGGVSSGSGYRLAGTIGQPDAERLHPATGAGFAITGGFWAGVVVPAPPRGDAVFADGFERP